MFQDQALTNVNLETFSKFTSVFSKSCIQNIQGAGDTSCANAPTLVQNDLDVAALSGVGSNYYDKMAGGFVTDGRVVYGS